MLLEFGLREGQELLDIGERPREPWLGAFHLLVRPGARGPRCVGVAGCLLGFCVGFGPGRWGLNFVLALGAVFRSIGVNFRAGR